MDKSILCGFFWPTLYIQCVTETLRIVTKRYRALTKRYRTVTENIDYAHH